MITAIDKAARALVEGRLDTPPSDILVNLYEAPHLEREKKQFSQYLQVDIAHTVMLAEQGVLTHDDAKVILHALQRIVDLGVERFPFDARKGSFLLQVENFLFDQIGERVGGRMHTGRSRLDQGPTVRRLYKRKQLINVFEELMTLQRVILRVAAEHKSTVMPGYTCMQHAHPSVFGHYLLAFSTRLTYDFDRLTAAYDRLNLNPLGAAGLAGTSWPIDRSRTAQLLGFDGVVENSKLAREAWYAADIAAGLSFVMATLNSLATDLHLWSTFEFGYVETADEFCGTSSIFPQKKNPAGLEAIKFAAGGSTTWLATALATFRAEGTGDVVMHEVPLLDDAFTSTIGSLHLSAAILSTLKVNRHRMSASANANWSTATNLADSIVRFSSWSFREAHSAVARLVRNCVSTGVTQDQVSASHFHQAAAELGLPRIEISTEEIRASLDAKNFAETRTSPGGTSQDQIERLMGLAEQSIELQAAWLTGAAKRLEAADRERALAVRAAMAH